MATERAMTNTFQPDLHCSAGSLVSVSIQNRPSMPVSCARKTLLEPIGRPTRGAK
jgi:hypothetical protein